MYRKLLAFLREEREEIAAFLPALFGVKAWPGEVWAMGLLVVALGLTELGTGLRVWGPQGLLVLLAMASIAQMLLKRSRASGWARLWSLLIFFLIPLVGLPAFRSRQERNPAAFSARVPGKSDVRDNCVKAPDTIKCRTALVASPRAADSLPEEEQLRVWRTAGKPLTFASYPEQRRIQLAGLFHEALAAYQQRNYKKVLLPMRGLQPFVDEGGEIQFYSRAAALGVKLQEEEELSRRQPPDPAQRRKTLAEMERDGEALRWSASYDPRARGKMLGLALSIRILDPDNAKALEWMRELGVRK